MKKIWIILLLALFAGGLFSGCNSDVEPIVELDSKVYLNPEDSLAMISFYTDLKVTEAGLEWDRHTPATWPGLEFDTVQNRRYVREIRIDKVSIPASLHPTVSSELGKLSHLTTFSLKSCEFWGILPSELFNCPLKYLSIYNNRNRETTEIIPKEIVNVSTTLEDLNIRFTSMESLPEEVGSLTNLKMLAIVSNNLSGMVPGFVFRMPAFSKTLEGNLFDSVNWYDLYTGLALGYTMPDLRYNVIQGEIPEIFDTDEYRDLVKWTFVPQLNDALTWYDGDSIYSKK